MAAAIRRDTGLVFICNPNNPTGTIVTKDEMKRFMDRVPESVTVLVDEAYSHFAGPDYESAIRYVKEERNVIVARTFSKAYGLAGMRIGYGIGKKDLMDRLRPNGLDFNLSVPAVAAAETALTDTQHIERVVKANDAQRSAFYSEMKKCRLRIYPFAGQFRHAEYPYRRGACYRGVLAQKGSGWPGIPANDEVPASLTRYRRRNEEVFRSFSPDSSVKIEMFFAL